MLRTLVGLSAVLPAVLASPYQHQKRADIDAFIEKENPIAREGILNNIGADGKLVPGAGPGIVVASPSEEYLFTWTRDAALTFLDLIHEFIDGDKELEPLIQQYITGQAKLQGVANPSGSLEDGAGLAEPKFHIDSTSFEEEWGRPQRDGPALRAQALIAYGNSILEGKKEKVVQNIWPVVSNDLSYVGQYWSGVGFDLWEEVNATSVFTISVQHKALVEGAAFAKALGKECAGCEVAPQILCRLQEFWDGKQIISNQPSNGRGGLDLASILTSLNAFDSGAKTCDDKTLQPCSARALANHKAVVDSFRETYGINGDRKAGKGAAVGRYKEDVYQGGNPWYLGTTAAAELLYDALYQWDKQGTLEVTDLSLPFFNDVAPDAAVGKFEKGSPEYKTITEAIKAYADDFIAVVQEYTPENGGLNEQYGRDDGQPTSVENLTWSFAAFRSAVARRAGNVPPAWGSDSSASVPSECSPDTVEGEYAQPTPGDW
ncbi:glucan 1,4-alpha-glucosidase [Aspergillus campestris IBT 28561]|uniref:glucan 1,4-alpha-glucosidase n=1 Tax=Aspergillus campestris (strain IBT 28561) TaxID=1392248 RepID=A0A2I1CUB7_ASPC2|nr:glucan 1,4-alpha-glucosidase [Aspergillus campestris IBT 28561]PKY01204.1 glucan 1,4-alpha-glucosidase [Aspergillus campestris IBT 28561]